MSTIFIVTLISLMIRRQNAGNLIRNKRYNEVEICVLENHRFHLHVTYLKTIVKGN